MSVLHRFLAGAALVLALASVVLGDFARSGVTIANKQIDVFELAHQIRGRNVVLTDLRDPADMEEFSLPGALSLSDTLVFLDNEASAATVVVFGYETNPVWHALRSRGHDVRFFANGVEQWLTHILNPVIYRYAPKSELMEFERRAEISQYFGGAPRYSLSPVQTSTIADQLARVRRGCGF